MINLIIFGILLCAPAALWGALCAINAMWYRSTRPSIAASFLLVAWGWGAIIFAAVDHLISEQSAFWPMVMLVGLLCLAAGNGLLHLANRRSCSCVGCPGKRRTSFPLQGG